MFSIIHGWTQTEEQKKTGEAWERGYGFPPSLFIYYSGSKTLLSVGRPGTEVAMALSSLSLPSQIELHCTSPHVPSIALRDVNLTTVSSPTTIHPHIPIIAGATSSGRVLLWDWLLFCRKKGFETCFWFWTFILTARKIFIISDKACFRLVSVSWSHWRINFIVNLFYVFLFILDHDQNHYLHQSTVYIEWVLAMPPQHLCCYSLRYSGFEIA